MKKLIDLHIHSNLSDGELSPKEIIDRAVNNGVCVIAIADHDTTLAYNDELFNYAQTNNIKIIPAVEISTKYKGIGIHVLGYNFDINNKKFTDKLYSIRNARHIYLHDVATKLKEFGYIIDVDSLDKIDSVTKAHIALNIVENEDNKELLLKTFGHIPSKGEFIEAIMNEGCPCYVEKEAISPKEASDLIREAGGIVVLAHPVAYKYENDLSDDDILNLVKEMNPDGIEANYVYLDRNGNKINESTHWNNFARTNNLIITIGSDFHKSDNVHPDIGLINEEIKLSNKEIDIIIDNLLN